MIHLGYGGWWHEDDEDAVGKDRLPQDLTPNQGIPCDGWHEEAGYLCTRNDGHTGRHAAGTSELVVAVWS